MLLQLEQKSNIFWDNRKFSRDTKIIYNSANGSFTREEEIFFNFFSFFFGKDINENIKFNEIWRNWHCFEGVETICWNAITHTHTFTYQLSLTHTYTKHQISTINCVFFSWVTLYTQQIKHLFQFATDDLFSHVQQIFQQFFCLLRLFNFWSIDTKTFI